jgi:YidC/Oxa1 family membrane protein insertase
VRVLFIFPVNIIAHKNALKLLKLQPKLSVIKRRFAGDREQLNEEQFNLFKKERYSPFLGLIPLLAQLILIIGIMRVMLDPMRHMHGISEESINFFFLGLNLLAVPSFLAPAPELIMPVLAVGSAFGFCLSQNTLSPAALSQSRGANVGLTVFTVVLSLYLTLVLPVAVGMYWTASNLVGIGVVILLNLMYSPKKLAPDAMAYLNSARKPPDVLRAEREHKKRLRQREKHDAAKFIEAKKNLLFYALTGGQYKYYKTIIDYILDNSEIVIHYLTNDSEDALFEQENPRLVPYYVGQRKTISLMLKLDADIVVTTVPDLQTYHIKRSIVRDDIEYIYVFHAPTSSSLIYREKAFDFFDTIFCVGPHQVTELRHREEAAGLRRRTLVKVGYGQYDQLYEAYGSMSGVLDDGSPHSKPRILIAPSWQKDNIFESCIDEILAALIGHDYEIVARPHPQFTRLFPERMEALVNYYAEYAVTGEIIFELDFSANQSIFTSDLLITDWSAISYEFAYCASKPCVFINTPMKESNPNWARYSTEPIDITLRDKVGVSVDIGDIPDKLSDAVTRVLADDGAFEEQVYELLRQYVFYPGRSGEAGGKYIIDRLKAKRGVGNE